MEYEIKPLTPEDAEYIEDRVNDCVKLNTPMGHTPAEEELVLKVKNDEGETIGGSILEFGGSAGARMQLSMLWVEERYRGKGARLNADSRKRTHCEGAGLLYLLPLHAGFPSA